MMFVLLCFLLAKSCNGPRSCAELTLLCCTVSRERESNSSSTAAEQQHQFFLRYPTFVFDSSLSLCCAAVSLCCCLSFSIKIIVITLLQFVQVSFPACW